MNVTVKENTDQKLRLALSPDGCILVGAGLLLVIAGLWVIWMIGKRIELTVDASTLHYHNSRLGGSTIKEFSLPVADVTDVTLELKEGFSPTYKVTLHTTDGLHEADLPLSDGDEKRAIVDQVSTALSQPDGEFVHQEDGIYGALFLGGVCIVGGLICFYFLQTVAVIADRPIGYLQVRRRRKLLPGGGDRREIELDDFKGIEIKETSVRSSSQVTTTSYNLLIHRRGGKPIPVAHGPMFTEESAQEAAALIENWVDGKYSDGEADDDGAPAA